MANSHDHLRLALSIQDMSMFHRILVLIATPVRFILVIVSFAFTKYTCAG